MTTGPVRDPLQVSATPFQDGTIDASFYPAQADVPAPVFVVCPGGGYELHAEHEGAPVAEWLNSIGVSAVVLRYRLRPERHPAGLADLQLTIRALRENHAAYGIDPQRIGALGFSAGAHLAGLAATASDVEPGAVPDLLVLGYPRVSLVRGGSEGSVENLLGPVPPVSLRRSLSLESRVWPGTPATFIWHTMEDRTVDAGQSLLLAETLHRHGVRCELHLFPHGEHGLGLAAGVPGVEQWPALCEEWLGQSGWTMSHGRVARCGSACGPARPDEQGTS